MQFISRGMKASVGGVAAHPESRSEASEYSCSSGQRLRDDGWTASSATLKTGVLFTAPPAVGERVVCVLAQLQYGLRRNLSWRDLFAGLDYSADSL
jgi:hypothetical protein